MEIPRGPDFYKPLSLRLSKILDDIGASDDVRKLSMGTAITSEILDSCRGKPNNASYYMFGSQAEGTTTEGLNSDYDGVLCLEDYEIYQCISDIPAQRDLLSRLIVRDENTKPGYCKLQIVKSRTPLSRSHVCTYVHVALDTYRFDCNDRIVQTAEVSLARSSLASQYTTHGPSLSAPVVRTAILSQLGLSLQHTTHGPAFTAPETFAIAAQDFVPASRCRSWPNAARKWLDRVRKYDWPSQDLIEKMKTLSFFVVGVGHPHSSERHLEWRISLSLQERLLMFSLNPTQFKCYILLKMIKKGHINKKLGEEAISSYHCKTCLFYMIENTPGYLWQPENLLACLQSCLKWIYRCAKTGNCPNYFIPEENMFDGRMEDSLRIKLEKICYALLIADCSFLLNIHYDDLAERITNSIFPATFTLDSGYTVNYLRIFLREYFAFINIVETSLQLLLNDVKNNTRSEAITEIFRCIYDLSHLEPVTEHTIDQIRRAADIVLPYLEISLSSIIIINKVEQGKAGTAVDLLLSSKWQELSNRSDRFSAKLKQATFLYILGQYEAVQTILLPIARSCLPLQRYSFNNSYMYMLEFLITEKKDTSFDKFRTSHYVPCIMFSPLEKNFIPTALAYEMLRSVHMLSGSLNNYRHSFRPDWAVVDGKIFLYFLMFLLSKAKGKVYTGTWITAMERVLIADPILRHRETALNLIGWCYKQEGNTDKAIEYFCMSLAQENGYNAAFWHLLFTICDMNSSRNKQTVK